LDVEGVVEVNFGGRAVLRHVDLVPATGVVGRDLGGRAAAEVLNRSSLALAFSAAVPVTTFSADSCAAVPCAGKLDGAAAGALPELEDEEVVELLEVAAFAIAPPPTAAAATAAPVTSMDLMLRICPPGRLSITATTMGV
jgi:hypothetical protein